MKNDSYRIWSALIAKLPNCMRNRRTRLNRTKELRSQNNLCLTRPSQTIRIFRMSQIRPPPSEGGGGSTPLYAANEKITKINVADEIKNSFLDYSMSVIISRALPDARDGLKPSQRRILFAMNDLGVMPNRKHIK